MKVEKTDDMLTFVVSEGGIRAALDIDFGKFTVLDLSSEAGCEATLRTKLDIKRAMRVLKKSLQIINDIETKRSGD